MLKKIKVSPSPWDVANKLAKSFIRTKVWSKTHHNIAKQLSNLSVTHFIEFVDRLRDWHSASASESGFNHTLDELALLMNKYVTGWNKKEN